MKRRDFLVGAGALGIASSLPDTLALAAAPMPQRVLVLGGTGFIGPPMLEYLAARGHEIAIFTRGNREADVPGVEHLVGDRAGDLSALEGRRWDVVFDNNARDYRWVQLTTELLADNVERYVFVSTISAYAGEALGYDYLDTGRALPVIDVGSPLAEPPDDFRMGDELPYGQTKALSEKIVREAFPGRATIVRPGFIVGPGDPTDRFTYWPVRIDKGGEVLAPGDGSDPVQIIDVRDLTEWIVRLAETATSGVFNGVGPAGRLSMAEMLYGIRAVTSTPVEFTWVPIPFLREQGVEPYSDMPIWIPADPLSAVGNDASIEAGLTFRPLAVTAADTLAWHEARDQAIEFGIAAERERAVLDAWRSRQAARAGGARAATHGA
jgi:2'-hydroxyisoflavone reductase